MQPKALEACSIAHFAKAHPRCEWDRARASEDSRHIVTKDLVGNARSQRSPVHERAALYHHARDFSFRKSPANRLQVWTSICSCRRDLLDFDPMLAQLLLLLFLREGAESQNIILCGLCDA